MLLKTLLLLTACAGLIPAAIIPDVRQIDPSTSLTFIKPSEVSKFLEENPNAIRLNKEVKSDNNGVTRDLDAYELHFTLGSRITNDALGYETISELMWFGEPVQPKLNVHYGEEGKVVTYVRIEIIQSSTEAEAFITSGGVGQKNIAFTVIGYDTWFWKWNVKIYSLLV